MTISESHTSHARNVPKRASHAFAAKRAERIAEMPWPWLDRTPKAAEGDNDSMELMTSLYCKPGSLMSNGSK